MSSPSLEERASDRAERGQRGAQRRTCRSPAALAPVLCYATDTVPPTRAPRAARAGAGTEPPHILAIADNPVALHRGSLAAFGGNHGRREEREREGSYEPQHRSRRCPGWGPADPERGSQRQRRVPPAEQRRSVRRSPPGPAAPAHLSATGSAHLPPSLSPAAAAGGGGPEPPGSAGARRCSSLSRRQLPLSLHPHIPPPAAAAAAPKFTALRRHEVILPAPSAGRRTPLPPRRGRRPRRPAARALPGPAAPPAPEEPPLP